MDSLILNARKHASTTKNTSIIAHVVSRHVHVAELKETAQVVPTSFILLIVKVLIISIKNSVGIDTRG